jgi:hypothetical protein
LFEEERERLESLLEELKAKKDIDSEVIEIITTWIEMLTRFPKAVYELDLQNPAFHDFMADKAEMFYEQFEQNFNNILGREITIEKNITYIYHFNSISFILGSHTLIYPFMLVQAINYSNFIQSLYYQLKNTETNFINFFNIFFELSKSGKARLAQRDYDFLKEATHLELPTKKEHFPTIRKFIKRKRYQRLKNLSVIAFYCTVNFPTLGLIPYIHLANHDIQIPNRLQSYVEQSLLGSMILRLFLVPIEYEKKWVDDLSRLGITRKLDEWYISYNLDTVYFSQQGSQEWKFDLSDLESCSETESDSIWHKYHLIIPTEKIKRKIMPRNVFFLEMVHRYQNVYPEELASMSSLNIQPRTAWNYFYRAIDEKAILFYLNIGQIGLDRVYQVIIENNTINYNLVNYLKILSKVRVMKSKDLYRFLIFLPAKSIESFEKFINRAEKQGDFEILLRGDMTFEKRTYRSVDLTQILSR